MLKIGKGLKKKKKSKKSKHKEEELFTEAELEQYRREHAQKVEPEGEEGGEASEAGGKEESTVKSEEFEKFKLLTAGVDDILRKSQGDLDRIKKESFFQRKPTPSEIKAQEEKEKAAQEQTKGNWIGFEEGKESKNELTVEDHQEESESEYEFEENDDLFDTAYVDALESGEVKLAYVPEDDELGFNDGPDPFDTTTADEILKKVEEEEKKKKKQISLGTAVNVLTGRADRDKSLLEETGVEVEAGTCKTTGVRPRQRPRKIQDLSLLGSFDDNGNPAVTPVGEVAETKQDIPKSLLDDDLTLDCDLPEGETLITTVLVKQAAERKEENTQDLPNEEDKNDNLKNLVSEFDVINEESVTSRIVSEDLAKAEEEDEFDEFTALAATSVLNQKLEEELQEFEALEDDPFDTSAAVNVLNEEPEKEDLFGSLEQEVSVSTTAQPLAPNSAVKENWSKFDADEEEEEVDPFDTSFVSKAQPGKCELKLLENEILGDIVANPLRKDIHQEARILSRCNSEFDADEKRGRQKVSIQITDPSGFVESQRGSESEVGDGDLVSLNFSHRDLLGGSTTDLSKLGDEPLPPSSESPLEDFDKYSDPFDTSIVEQVSAPGRAELKYIEKELLDDIPNITSVLDDEEFDPRAEEEQGSLKQVAFSVPSPVGSDLLSSVREEGTRPLTPYYADPELEPEVSDIEDPFDTSYVTSLPGKQELKLIEQELEKVENHLPVFVPIHAKLSVVEESSVPEPGIKHSLSDQDFNPREEPPETLAGNLTTSVGFRRFSDITGLSDTPPLSLPLQSRLGELPKPDLLAVEEEIDIKALTPAVEEDISSYIDPFDTSIAENIAPGKAELRLLEKELVIEATVGGVKRTYSDPDFDPRGGSEDNPPDIPAGDILSLPESSIPATKPLTPLEFPDEIGGDEDIDPFDTSIATNLVPGKAELRLLESELFG